jgi:hypothetical protein
MKRFLETEQLEYLTPNKVTIDLLDIDFFYPREEEQYTTLVFKSSKWINIHISYEKFKELFIDYHEGLYK